VGDAMVVEVFQGFQYLSDYHCCFSILELPSFILNIGEQVARSNEIFEDISIDADIISSFPTAHLQ